MRNSLSLIASIAFSIVPLNLALAGGDLDLAEPDCGSLSYFSGAEVVGGSNGSWESYSGGIYALNRDLCKRGVLLRAMVSYGEYEYEVQEDPWWPELTTIDADYFQGDIMIGYQLVRSRFDVAFYVGVDFLDHDLAPDDPANSVNGSETGFKVAADIEANDEQKIYYLAEGSYSTAFDTYYALGQLGINLNGIIIGVEGWALGDEDWEANRVGGFLRFNTNLMGKNPSQFVLSVGHQNDTTGGNFSRSEGIYGTFHSKITF